MMSCFETRDRPEDIPLFSVPKSTAGFYIQKYYLVATAEIPLEDSLKTLDTYGTLRVRYIR